MSTVKRHARRLLGERVWHRLFALRRAWAAVWRAPWLHRPRRLLERVLWGGPRRERLLVGLLDRYYESLFRRRWRLGAPMPHFMDLRIVFFQLGFGRRNPGPYPFSRGFFAAEVLRPGDRLLDIGCGDGFFACRFFAPRCVRIDAIDVEPSAIATAERWHAAPNIRYVLADATAEPFPEPPYDVIVWDGALGHFASRDVRVMLEKIAAALASGGIFVGSESLGREGHDHLQFFASPSDLRRVLERVFPLVELREVHYPSSDGHLQRREAYWRCATDGARMEQARWQRSSH